MLSIVVGALVWMIAYTIAAMNGMSLRAKAKLSIVSVYIIGILLWPTIWKVFMKENIDNSTTYPSLVWPIMILSIETYLLKYHTFEQHLRKNKSLLSIDANAICSLTFALSSILGAQKDSCCKDIFIYGVLGCIAFVMPTPEMPSETIESIVIDSIQKVVLTYSTGLLLGGSMLLMTHDDSSKVL